MQSSLAGHVQPLRVSQGIVGLDTEDPRRRPEWTRRAFERGRRSSPDPSSDETQHFVCDLPMFQIGVLAARVDPIKRLSKAGEFLHVIGGRFPGGERTGPRWRRVTNSPATTS
jgi:hypothetical protein